MPLSAWLGQSDRPGDIAGHGPEDADTCRDIAAALTAQPATRYCLTLTTPDGHPAGHACTRTPPPGQPPPPAGPDPPGHGPAPPGGPPDPGPGVRQWLGSLKFDWLDDGPCGHSLETPRYRPSAKLAHLIQVRNPTCTAPGCRRAAHACDLDHVLAYQKGGRTCSCNLHPLCRKHHQLKQEPGWHVHMPESGTLIWTLPHGRSYTTNPEPYPV
jgi:hypothetical protein